MCARPHSLAEVLAGLLVAAAAAASAALAADEPGTLRELEGLLLRTKYVEAEAFAAKSLAAYPKSAPLRCLAARLHAAGGTSRHLTN